MGEILKVPMVSFDEEYVEITSGEEVGIEDTEDKNKKSKQKGGDVKKDKVEINEDKKVVPIKKKKISASIIPKKFSTSFGLLVSVLQLIGLTQQTPPQPCTSVTLVPEHPHPYQHC
jgi:hypothetical protein